MPDALGLAPDTHVGRPERRLPRSRSAGALLWSGALLGVLVLGVLSVLALFWLAVYATPACTAPRVEATVRTARLAMVAVGVGNGTLLAWFGLRVLRPRWGWLVWGPLTAAAALVPVAVAVLFTVPAVGGLFCL